MTTMKRITPVFSFFLLIVLLAVVAVSCIIAPPAPKLIVSTSGKGTTTRVPDNYDNIYAQGDVVTVTASNSWIMEILPLNIFQDEDGQLPPTFGYRFINWTDDLASDAVVTTDTSFSVTMDKTDRYFSANFPKYGAARRTMYDAAGTTVSEYDAFTYDANGQITEYANWNAAGTTKNWYYTYEYTEAGLLSKCTYYLAGAKQYYLTYEYNSSSKPTLRKKYSNADSKQGDTVFTYSGAKLSSLTYRDSSETKTGDMLLDYDTSGKLVKLRTRDNTEVLLSSATFTYDENNRCVGYATFTGASETSGDYYAWAYNVATGEITGYKKYNAAGTVLNVFGLTLADF